jgi:FtsH-binding integral membrane protein
VVSGVLAFLTSANTPVRDLFFVTSDTGRLVGITALGSVLRWAPLLVLLGAMFMMRNPSARSSGILYWLIVSMIGAGAGIWLLIYTSVSVYSTFFITATAFGALSLYGYATKRDLTGFGNFLIMGLWGIIIAAIVNIFIQSSVMAFAISAIGVLIFAGLTAFDTQRLKMTYYALGGDQTSMAVATNFGALNLYLDFINLFQFLLMFLGVRRD